MGQASLPIACPEETGGDEWDDARASAPVPPPINHGILLPEKPSSLETRPGHLFCYLAARSSREEPDASGRELVVAAMKSFDGQRYQLVAYVVMDDHVHALLTPFAGYELKAILHSWEVVHRPSDAARA